MHLKGGRRQSREWCERNRRDPRRARNLAVRRRHL